jgi:predicted HTH transcriptional regulator
MVVQMSEPKVSARELQQVINVSNNVAGYKINLKKSVALLYTNDKMINGLKKISGKQHTK